MPIFCSCLCFFTPRGLWTYSILGLGYSIYIDFYAVRSWCFLSNYSDQRPILGLSHKCRPMYRTYAAVPQHAFIFGDSKSVPKKRKKKSTRATDVVLCIFFFRSLRHHFCCATLLWTLAQNMNWPWLESVCWGTTGWLVVEASYSRTLDLTLWWFCKELQQLIK